jgi:hypothetical protein
MRNGHKHLHKVAKTTSMNREMDRYFKEHPGSASAVRRPRVYSSGATFVALLGSDFQTGIAGLGRTVGAALRAFDSRYEVMAQAAYRKLVS